MFRNFRHILDSTVLLCNMAMWR